MSFQILVVDDTKFMRKMLTDILKQYGHEVVGEAENGRQAVQKYEELQPDIVLMDITMPEMDGIEAMKEIRLLNPTAVVLICSAMSQQDLISDALKAGANGYVMKPFKPNRVNEIVRKYGVPRVIGHLIPQDMQRSEVVHAEPEVVETTHVEEELAFQAAVAEGAAAQAEAMKAVDQAFSEPEELQPTELDMEVLHEVESSTGLDNGFGSKLVPDVAREPEVIELQASLSEPEIKPFVVEEKKIAAKPSQVVNALEVLLAFAEVAESKEAAASEHKEEITVTTNLPSEDRTLEMERLAAVMQGDMDEEWEINQLEAASAREYGEAAEGKSASDEPIEGVAVDIEPPPIELSLEELNEMTLEMSFEEPTQETQEIQGMEEIREIHDIQEIHEIQASELEMPEANEQVSVNASNRTQPFKAVNGGKIINLFRGIGPMKNFTSSVMCNWSEEVNNDMTQYLVVCTEAENKIEIEMAGANGQKQSITVTIESFNQLAAWLQVQLGTAPVSNREYAKKADF
ncbi:hypothetical protein A8709_25245 [Paenibacillus pectinilyticus]|uniref:Response regulatory domain-containing protein n=1 Tax=Paenibacillus pectinilyticus TaxID=512399 RepID=A0A1C1A0U3_9BACL|nr:hypothetical protein A8709_25245 [Paenibacillus pectinilyticus]